MRPIAAYAPFERRCRLPVRAADACTSSPVDDWRLAADRVERYLHALGVGEGERYRQIAAVIAAAAREPAWASGKGATSCAILVLQRQLAEVTAAADRDATMTASAAARLRRWLNAAPDAAAQAPLETDADGHQRLATMPPMRRVHMAPAPIDRRPAPWRWLGRLWGAE